MRNGLSVAFLCLLAGSSSGEGITVQDMLSVARFAGACRTRDSMIQFQKSTNMPGGNEFVTRFWSVESARLRITDEQLSQRCTESIAAYDTLWNAAAD